MTKTPLADQHTDAKTIAREINAAEATVRLWTAKGVIPPIKVGRKVLYDGQAIERCLQEKSK